MPITRIVPVVGALLVLLVARGRSTADELTRAADEGTCREAGLATDGPALLRFVEQRTPSATTRVRLAAAVRRLGDRSFRAREQASAELLAAGRMAVPLLRPVLNSPDLEVARRAQHCLAQIESNSELSIALAVARLLAVRRPTAATRVILDYVPFVDDDQLEQELLVTLQAVGIVDGKVSPLLVDALKDRTAARRSAAAWILGRSATAPLRDGVRPLLADADATVRLRAAQGLIAAKEKEAIPVLVQLLQDAPPAVAAQAEEDLYRIAGDQAPQVAVGTGTAAERRQCREAWARWWSEHGNQIDLATLDVQKHLLGLTFLVSLDGYGGQGRVWECGRDGKPRWEVRTVKGPIDAQLLPGNRVLVAEYYAHQVSERDFQGKLLWKYALSGPVSCQRLPNGNTLLGSNREIVEVSPQGKAVFTLQPKGTLFSVQKLRNGHLVYATYEGMLVEVDNDHKELKSFRFERPTDGKITFEVLPGGRYLIPLSNSGHVAELDSTGKIVWQCPVEHPNSATRLPNGNTLVCSRQDCRVVEVDRTGKVVWEMRQEGHLFRVSRR
jgi:hypothetical protein